MNMDLQDVLKIGILGGKQTGKSYLFQSMVFRTQAPDNSGALTRFLKGGRVDLLQTEMNGSLVYELELQEFAEKYAEWDRLAQNNFDNQIWYKLRFQYRCGLLGLSRNTMDIEFLDASGEALSELAVDDPSMASLWERAYLHAKVVVFCLPMWAVWHHPLSEEDLHLRRMYRKDFGKVAQRFNTLRSKKGVDHPVRTVLALTMADDPRVSLESVKERWIRTLLNEEHLDQSGRCAMERHLQLVRSSRGLNQYLESTRQISDAMQEAFLSHRDSRLQSYPGRLNFGAGDPWIIPVSAIDGQRLQEVERTNCRPDLPPSPVHVELPLLIAICEAYNAMM